MKLLYRVSLCDTNGIQLKCSSKRKWIAYSNASLDINPKRGRMYELLIAMRLLYKNDFVIRIFNGEVMNFWQQWKSWYDDPFVKRKDLELLLLSFERKMNNCYSDENHYSNERRKRISMKFDSMEKLWIADSVVQVMYVDYIST